MKYGWPIIDYGYVVQIIALIIRSRSMIACQAWVVLTLVLNHTYARTHVHTHARTHKHTHTYNTHIYIIIHTHTNTHTNTHTYTHTHTYFLNPLNNSCDLQLSGIAYKSSCFSSRLYPVHINESNQLEKYKNITSVIGYKYRKRGKIRWAKHLGFQLYEVFHGNIFVVP